MGRSPFVKCLPQQEPAPTQPLIVHDGKHSASTVDVLLRVSGVTGELTGRIPDFEFLIDANYLSIGIEMGAALVVGMAIGWFLDRTFGTKPWFLIVFTAFGIAAGFINVIKAARKAAKDEDKL